MRVNVLLMENICVPDAKNNITVHYIVKKKIGQRTKKNVVTDIIFLIKIIKK